MNVSAFFILLFPREACQPSRDLTTGNFNLESLKSLETQKVMWDLDKGTHI